MHFKICCCCDSKQKENKIDNGNENTTIPVTDQPVPLFRKDSHLFKHECLVEHNRLRAFHGCPPLRLNRNLSAYAAEWAKTLADRNIVLEYRAEARYGENLFVAREYSVDARAVVKTWYDEVWLYNFSKPGYVPGVEHFTQVVWRDTKELGIGIEKRGGNTWIVVNYEPKGNIIGRFEENVPKLL